MSTKTYENKAAPGVPFFTPAQEPPAGTALNPQPDGKPIPKCVRALGRANGAAY